MYVQYVTILCMISSLQILEKDWVEVLELLASPLGRSIWDLDIILWAICTWHLDIQGPPGYFVFTNEKFTTTKGMNFWFRLIFVLHIHSLIIYCYLVVIFRTSIILTSWSIYYDKIFFLFIWYSTTKKLSSSVSF